MTAMRPNPSARESDHVESLFEYADRRPLPQPDDEFWSLKMIKAKTGLSRSTIYVYVAQGEFPRQRRLGPRRVGWLASEVRTWMAGRPQQGNGAAIVNSG